MSDPCFSASRRLASSCVHGSWDGAVSIWCDTDLEAVLGNWESGRCKMLRDDTLLGRRPHTALSQPRRLLTRTPRGTQMTDPLVTSLGSQCPQKLALARRPQGES